MKQPAGARGPHAAVSLRCSLELHQLLRAWNAGDALDYYDFANHQHRHGVHWLM